MRILNKLFENNRAWAGEMVLKDPEYFRRLLDQQRPKYLWIGCSDSRVPANEIVGLHPGELFVHRNVANLVVHGDLNGLSVLQFAVEVLHVLHIIVCGHYRCGGVLAALRGDSSGFLDKWLCNVTLVREKNRALIDALESEEQRHDRLCELNVIEQVVNVCRTPILQNAWARSQAISVHGWMYQLEDGMLSDLDMCVTHPGELNDRYETARGKTASRITG